MSNFIDSQIRESKVRHDNDDDVDDHSGEVKHAWERSQTGESETLDFMSDSRLTGAIGLPSTAMRCFNYS